MREICQSGSEGGAAQPNVPFLPLSNSHGLKPNAIRESRKREARESLKQKYLRFLR